MSRRRANPLTFVAILLVAGVAAAVGRSLGGPQPAPEEGCDPESGLGCAPPPEGALPGGTVLPGPDAPSLPAEVACRNAGYLCAELERSDRIRITRWRDFQGTLVVFVPRPPISDPTLAERLQSAASAGIRLWNGRPFPVLVDERGNREAHFAVEWVTSLGDSRIGLARTRWSSTSGLEVAGLELATASPFSGRPLDPAQVRLVAAHEMGHALGLPHSDEPRDVMFPANTATVLSTRDYRTLEAVYALEDGTEIVSAPRR